MEKREIFYSFRSHCADEQARIHGRVYYYTNVMLLTEGEDFFLNLPLDQ